MGRRRATFELTRLAYNPESATAFGLVFKLAYAATPPAAAVLEIFVASDAAEAGDWATYGAPDAQKYTLHFAAPGETQDLVIEASAYRIRFEAVRERPVTYPAGSPERLPARRFSIERLG